MVFPLDFDILAPGHGPVIEEPGSIVDSLIAHRLKRESGVVAALRSHPGLTLRELTPHVYAEVDAKLHRLASRSLLAHLLKLEREGHAVCVDERWTLAQAP